MMESYCNTFFLTFLLFSSKVMLHRCVIDNAKNVRSALHQKHAVVSKKSISPSPKVQNIVAQLQENYSKKRSFHCSTKTFFVVATQHKSMSSMYSFRVVRCVCFSPCFLKYRITALLS